MDEKVSAWFFVMTTMLPLDDGLAGLPRLIGMFLMTWSFLLTVMVWVARETLYPGKMISQAETYFTLEPVLPSMAGQAYKDKTSPPPAPPAP